MGRGPKLPHTGRVLAKVEIKPPTLSSGYENGARQLRLNKQPSGGPNAQDQRPAVGLAAHQASLAPSAGS